MFWHNIWDSVAAIFIFLFSCSAFCGPFDYRPDLYIDGPILAENLAKKICGDSKSIDISNYNHQSLFSSAFLGNHGDKFGPVTNDYTWKNIKEEFNHKRRRTINEVYTEKYLTNSKNLENWILSRPDNSIAPLELALQAIQIENGNILEGLRLAYNLTSDGWGIKNTFIKRPIFAKLIDITGENLLVKDLYNSRKEDRPKEFEKVISTRGGKASAWYHFFGAASVAYDEGTKSLPIKLPCDMASASARLMGRAGAGSLIALENVTDKYLRSIFGYKMNDLTKRAQINNQGVEFGASLAKNMTEIAIKKECSRYQNLPPSEYLYDRPDLYGEKWRLKPGQMPYEFIGQ